MLNPLRMGQLCFFKETNVEKRHGEFAGTWVTFSSSRLVFTVEATNLQTAENPPTFSHLSSCCCF